VVAGVASVATLPVAIYLTRFSDTYELLDSAVAIPVAAVLALLALGLSSRARRRAPVVFGGPSGSGPARAGRLLGILGLCLVASALVALGVYGLLEYAGSRE
jgi:ABC-type Fe3+ transport system permease subunit